MRTVGFDKLEAWLCAADGASNWLLDDAIHKVIIGFDPNETITFHALNLSIQSRASAPVAVIPIMLSQLNSVFKLECARTCPQPWLEFWSLCQHHRLVT